MSVVSYKSGINAISLSIVKTNECSRRAIYSDDGQDFLYSEWVLDVNCYFNRAATSYGAGGAFTANQSPADTDAAIRQLLLTPRGQLYYGLEDGSQIIKVPDDNAACDPRGGPYPEELVIRQITGQQTWLVRWRIRFYENTCGSAQHTITSPRTILSHRWSQRAETDEDFFTTRTTEGILVCRMDQLVKWTRVPDDFRAALKFVIPTNFKRTNINVEARSDGTALHYRFTDTQMSHSLGADSAATRVDAYLTTWANIPSIASNIFDEVKDMGPLDIMFAMSPYGWFKHGKNIAMKSLPQSYRHVIIRCWGSPTSRRKDLKNIAIGIAASCLGITDLATLPALECSLKEQMTGKFVEFQGTLRFGQNPTSVIKIASFLTNAVLDEIFPPSETVEYKGKTFVSGDPGPQPAPPGSNGTRGDWFAEIAAQVLKDPCSQPPYQVPREAIDLEPQP